MIGFYDGAVGPGTGSFLIFALHGAPLWGLGLIMGLANLLGGLLGARTAVAKGSRFVRVVFLVVVSALILRLAYDVFFA